MKRNLRNILIATLSLVGTSIPFTTLARPAYPEPMTVTQPDGTRVNITLKGNWKNKQAFTSDGYLLSYDSNGYYVFADLDANGNIIPSAIRAYNPEARTTEINAFLAKINKQEVLDSHTGNLNKKSKSLSTRGPGLCEQDNYFPTTGKQKGLVVLVDFPNCKFSVDNPHDFFFRMLNEEGFSDAESTGSARDYFVSNSNGLFQPEFDVYGPITMSRDYQYYGKNIANGDEPNAPQMFIEAARAINDDVDFHDYDRNNDGVIDFIYVFYAGYGEADGGAADTIWPHSWCLRESMPNAIFSFDGLRLDNYACSNELSSLADLPEGVGAFVHEFSHVLGLPDDYSTITSRAFTPSYWDVMDIGSYLNNSRTPPNFASHQRYALDWIKPTVMDHEGKYTIHPLQETNEAFILVNEDNPNEFYMFENRQKTGNDKYLPGHGMLVWHIDFVQDVWTDNSPNNDATHQHIDLIEADNLRTNSTLADDAFPGGKNITSFTCETLPAFMWWDVKKFPPHITNIQETLGKNITFTVENHNDAGIDNIISHTNPIKVEGNTISGTGEIFDMYGRKVATLNSSSATLPSGLYIIKTSSATRKISI